MTVYVTNLCPNPSFEAGVAGWSSLTGTSIGQDDTYALSGGYSMLVTTDGSVTGEGVTGPSVSVASATTGAVSFSVLPTADVTLTVDVVTSGGTVLASTLATVTAGPLFQRIILQNFAIPASSSIGLLVATSTPQAVQFWIDAVQYETGVSAASAYIDGDQPGCIWTGTAELSSSELLYLNPVTATGALYLAGSCSPVQVGEIFLISASGNLTLSGTCTISNLPPQGAFADFAIFELTDVDPALSYPDWNNAGTDSGLWTVWASNYGVFVPPLDFQNSTGDYTWRRANYMGIGFYFTGVGGTQEQNLTDIQVALSPLASTPLPPSFTPPRQIATIIKPTRLNFCTNPSFEVSTAGWTPTGSAALAQDTNVPSAAYQTLLQAGNLSTYYNSSGITYDGGIGSGNLDGSGDSYSSVALGNAGLGAGQTFISAGISYTMPAVASGALDNIECLGQTIIFPSVAGVQFVGFIGASVSGSGQTGTVTINYSDTSSVSQTLGLSNWLLTGGQQYGNQVAAQMPYYNAEYGTEVSTTNYIFSAILPANSGKMITSITLPNVPGMHLFAISMAAYQGNSYGNYSCKITVNANGDGMELSIPDLISGDTYTVSFLTEVGPGIAALVTEVGADEFILSNTTIAGTTYGGPPGYGLGYYGGISSAGADLTTGIWYRPSLTFQATASTQALFISSEAGSDISYPADFWVDAVLIEAGEVVGSYFDGSFGSTGYQDYQWESGGTPGLSRSYYYEQFTVKKYTIQQILNQHTPLGRVAATPQYLIPYTQ